MSRVIVTKKGSFINDSDPPWQDRLCNKFVQFASSQQHTVVFDLALSTATAAATTTTTTTSKKNYWIGRETQILTAKKVQSFLIAQQQQKLLLQTTTIEVNKIQQRKYF